MIKNNPDSNLSEIEIKKLFAFTKKKFVNGYDLQIELVDHLASSIENEMQLNSKLTFESALEKVYKNFGVLGFAKIVQERQNQLYRAGKKRWWNELKNMFRLPDIILNLLIFSVVWTFAYSVSSNILTALFFIIYITISLMFFIYVVRDLRIQKQLLLMQSGASYFSLPFIYEICVFSNSFQLSPLSFTIILYLGILIKFTSFRLYNKIRKEAELLYPSVFVK